MISRPESRNGHKPVALEASARGGRLIQRVLSWVDVAVAHLISDRRRRALVQRSRELDGRLERAAHRLARRSR